MTTPGLQVVALRIAAVALFSAMSLCIRLASADVPLGQVVFFRSFVALLPITAFMIIVGAAPRAFFTKRPMAHVTRNILSCAATFLSFATLARLPLYLATALSFLMPFFSILLARFLLGERSSIHVTVACIGGFIGVVIMLKPGLSGTALGPEQIIGICAGLATAFVSALSRIQIKNLTATEHPATVALYFALALSGAGLATAPLGWVPVEGLVLAYLVAAGLLGGLAHLAGTAAIGKSSISAIAPFEYTAMLWALSFDAAMFGLLPSGQSLAGAGLIIACALYVVLYDRRRP